MSISKELVRAYVKNKLAQAVSAGIIQGKTKDAAGHTHRFAVMFDEHDRKFIGETDFDGSGPHIHYILASVLDVVQPTMDPQPRTEEDVIVTVNEANTPAAMKKILDFYNMKEISLTTSPYSADGHTHQLTVRFAGKNIDRMGRPVQASAFDEGLKNVQAEGDERIADRKQRAISAEEELNARLKEAFDKAKKTKYEK